MNQEEIKETKRKYYGFSVLDKILRQIYFPSRTPNELNLYREFAMLPPVNEIGNKLRTITFSNVTYMIQTIMNDTYKKYNYLNDKSNLYCSVPRVKIFPMFSFSGKQRTKETSVFHKKEYKDYIVYYDIFIDFDIFTLPQLKEFASKLFKTDKKELTPKQLTKAEELLTVKNMNSFILELKNFVYLLNTYKLKFQVVFSGNRGFKVLIFNEIYNYKTAIRLSLNIAEKFNLTYADINSYTISKLMKINYSIVYNKDKFSIALPLNSVVFEDILNRLLLNKNFDIFRIDNLDIAKDINLYPEFFINDYESANLREFVKKYELLKPIKKKVFIE